MPEYELIECEEGENIMKDEGPSGEGTSKDCGEEYMD
jgi:hypothetical protein